MSWIRVRELALVGSRRRYGLKFTDNKGAVRPLSIISGEILTGKTSVLQFIAYCLGRDDYPTHDEIKSNVQVALLEIEIDHVVYVIERTCVERSSRKATIHSCSIAEMPEPHPSIELTIRPPSSEDSLSHFLLDQLGIADIDLREAPTQQASGTDRLSIVDLLRLVFIRYHDLGTQYLLQENRPFVRLKLEQLIDVLFGAHDNRAATIAASVKKLDEEIAAAQERLDAVLAFLQEQRIPAKDVLENQQTHLAAEVTTAKGQLNQIEEQMAAVGEFGAEQRSRYQQAVAAANRAANNKRDVTTQIERLSALASQYDQDVKKVTFAVEANLLFDPLLIQVCPWCMQRVETEPPGDSSCTVCHQPLVSDETADTSEGLGRELSALRRRLGELTSLLEELRQSALVADDAYASASAEARDRQAAFDQMMRGRFAPFIDQRDALIESIAAATQQSNEVERSISMHAGAERRRLELGQKRQRRAELLQEQLDAQETNTTRVQIASLLSSRYVELLERFHYPKMSDARLDSRFVPFARGQRYNDVGSTGAATLIALAWYLAIFESAVEKRGPHLGLLMIDSPQKGLRSAIDSISDQDETAVAEDGAPDDEGFEVQSIASAVYEHLVSWAASDIGSEVQLIVVENSPPEVAADHIIVTYTGLAERPPYGLIDDATS